MNRTPGNPVNYYCRVCGLRQAEPPWGESGLSPNYYICFCCGVEFGLGDRHELNIKGNRFLWLSRGTPWYDSEMQPKDWTLQAQLRQVPKEYRYPDEPIWRELGN